MRAHVGSLEGFSLTHSGCVGLKIGSGVDHSDHLSIRMRSTILYLFDLHELALPLTVTRRVIPIPIPFL
jgi:hypothetical protein